MYHTVYSSFNTTLGYHAGFAWNLGWNNTLIGADCNTTEDDLFNSIALGHNVSITESNQARIGNSVTSSIGGYENWKINAVVLESFKGKFKKGDAIEYFHGAEAGFKPEYFTGEKIVFLLNERGPGAEFPYTVLENSTLSCNEDRVRKLRAIRRSSVSRRTRR